MRIDFDKYYIASLNTSKPELFFQLLNNNRARLEDFFAGTLSKTSTLTNTQEYCLQIEIRRERMEYLPYIIHQKETDRYIGLIDVKNINLSIPKAELGYLIDASYEGQGIISKALGLAIDYLTEHYKFKKLLCRAAADNKGSIQVALKNGFELEGIIRRDYKTMKNEVVDLNYYGRIFDY